ncbi:MULTISPECIES: hypothetical protein [unclassified Streptomyces]|uniref:hypothetical protein n=1 Tax=unclassified Streptomyces TaxID=2593676 RepID=UPI002E2B4E0A|nr:hypothetical protein [Streptomyces sp. NBC_01429]
MTKTEFTTCITLISAPAAGDFTSADREPETPQRRDEIDDIRPLAALYPSGGFSEIRALSLLSLIAISTNA